MLWPEPVDGDAVFGDGDDVDLSWLAGFVYEETERRRLILVKELSKIIVELMLISSTQNHKST